jgi:class 3 adenylate cyclase
MRGDRAMHERMAALVQPGQRSAAVLFADLEASGSLSRRLPSPVYFRLVRDIRTALEGAVADCGGIVGKHAGDGVSAFFLPEQLDSASGAARAALETGRHLSRLTREAADGLADEGLPVDPDACRLKVAIHWGPSLYVGQVASQGRLEITALGDEMNEAARIEQSAEGGQVLASKPLLEQLGEDDASALSLDPARVAYRALAEIEGVSEKAKRDAGSIAVADVG